MIRCNPLNVNNHKQAAETSQPLLEKCPKLKKY